MAFSAEWEWSCALGFVFFFTRGWVGVVVTSRKRFRWRSGGHFRWWQKFASLTCSSALYSYRVLGTWWVPRWGHSHWSSLWRIHCSKSKEPSRPPVRSKKDLASVSVRQQIHNPLHKVWQCKIPQGMPQPAAKQLGKKKKRYPPTSLGISVLQPFTKGTAYTTSYTLIMPSDVPTLHAGSLACAVQIQLPVVGGSQHGYSEVKGWQSNTNENGSTVTCVANGNAAQLH